MMHLIESRIGFLYFVRDDIGGLFHVMHITDIPLYAFHCATRGSSLPALSNRIVNLVLEIYSSVQSTLGQIPPTKHTIPNLP